MDEFKTQFPPHLLEAGHQKVNIIYHAKYYVSRFAIGGTVRKYSHKTFKRASEAESYGQAVVERYQKKCAIALDQFIKEQALEEHVHFVEPAEY